MANYLFVTLVFACVLSCVILKTQQTVCPHCLCPVSFSPLCARQETTGKLRGFPNQCTLDCMNRCRKRKFVFAAPGRCGALKKKLAASTELPFV